MKTKQLFLATGMFISVIACKQTTEKSEENASETNKTAYPMSVCAKSGTTWYEAQVLSENNGTYHVKYYDNMEADLMETEIKKPLSKSDLKPNDRVLAVWRKGIYYEGTVSEISLSGATVVWDDGSTPSLVPFSKIAKGFPKSNLPKYADFTGTEFAVENNGSFVQGKLIETKKGISKMLTTQNSFIEVPESTLVSPLMSTQNIKKGMTVMAIWSSSIYYEGTVTGIQKDGITVSWKDGSKPSFVENGNFFEKKN